MGIPHFGARMKRHAVSATIGSSESPVRNSVAVIDGPGLAHHVFYELCESQNVDERAASYAGCADAAVKWLTTLRMLGYTIGAILFDGALPDSKRKIRIGRLQSYIYRMVMYKHGIGKALPVLCGPARKILPPPPFLVFAIVEELLQHAEFAKVTHVIPGEADPYCVAAAYSFHDERPDDTIAIFSDDADLIVYEANQKTCVVPFRDLSKSSDASGVTWTGDQYWPAQIAAKTPMKLRSLVQPAFLMELDLSLTWEAALQDLQRSDVSQSVRFPEYAHMFSTDREVGEWAKASAAWPSLDSRVSEIVAQVRYEDSNGGESGIRMFLPFLIEDPTKKTAWSISYEIRCLAYSFFLEKNGVNGIILEFKRSEARLVSTPVESLDSSALRDRCQELAAHIRTSLEWAQKETRLSCTDAWRYVVVRQVLQHLEENEYPLPSSKEIRHVLCNREEREWRLVHLGAQYQAAYYSLRMLKQILCDVSRKGLQDGGAEDNDDAGLGHQLDHLPRISEFFMKSVEGNGNDDVWGRGINDLLRDVRGQDGDDDSAQSKPRKKTKREGRDDDDDVGEGSLANNRFAMLSGD